MAKAGKRSKSSSQLVEAATAADVKLASSLIPSTRKERGWTLSATLAETFGNPKMQAALRSVAKELAVLGIEVDDLLTTANEAKAVNEAMVRLDESAGRAHQRGVELNKRMQHDQTLIVKAAESAAPTTAIAKALRGLVALRKKQLTQVKQAAAHTSRKKGGKGTPAT